MYLYKIQISFSEIQNRLTLRKIHVTINTMGPVKRASFLLIYIEDMRNKMSYPGQPDKLKFERYNLPATP